MGTYSEPHGIRTLLTHLPLLGSKDLGTKPGLLLSTSDYALYPSTHELQKVVSFQRDRAAAWSQPRERAMRTLRESGEAGNHSYMAPYRVNGSV